MSSKTNMMQVVGLPIKFVSFRVSDIKRSAAAKIIVDGGHEISFKKFSPKEDNWMGSRNVGFRLCGSWQTEVVIEVSTFRSDGERIHKIGRSKPRSLWNFISWDEERTIELYTSDNAIFGVAHVHIAVEPSELVKPEFGPTHPLRKVPTFKTLFETITTLEVCRDVDKSSQEHSHRLAEIFLWLLWKYLKEMWEELICAAKAENVDHRDLRDNAFEDTLNVMLDQANFLAAVVGVMKKHPTMRRLRDNAERLLHLIAKSAALLFQYGNLYTTATYGTLQLVFKEEGLFNKLRTIQQAHLYLRTQVLADYHGDRSLFEARRDLVKDLLTRSLIEYKKGDTWAWSSYTTAFALLRYDDAHDAYTRIFKELETQQASSDPAVRDFLRRLLAHTMLSARCPPPNLVLDGVHLKHNTANGPAKKASAPAHVGNGSYGVVYEAKYRGEAVAVKCLKLTADMTERSLHPEIINCYTLRHSHIVQLRGITRDNGTLSLIFPWMEYGQVSKFMQSLKAKKLPNLDRLSRKWMLQVASALAYIHGEGIAHGDLRGANILVNDKGDAHISDFGLSVYANGHSRNYDSTRQGNEGWLAPELQRDAATGKPSRPTREGDIFSFAMACIEMYTGKDPWAMTELTTSRLDAIMGGKRPNRPLNPDSREEMNKALWDLVTQCWHKDPSRRPTAKSVMEALRKLQLL